jgi:hypothetical protein
LIRADGILVPFAVFDGHAWTEAWPVPDDGMAGTASSGMIAAVPSLWRDRRQPVPQSWRAPMLVEGDVRQDAGFACGNPGHAC